MLSSQSDTSKSLRANRIHERFDRDFLPRYGGLWRSLIPSNESQTAVAKKPDFLDAILTRRPVHINVQSGMEKCNCGECQPPIMDWEQECRESNDDKSDPEGYSSTESMDQQDLGEEASFKEGKAPATPLPTDLDDAFGRLTCDGSPNTDQHDPVSDCVRRTSFERCDGKGKGNGVVSVVADQQDDVSCYSAGSGYHVDGFPYFPGSSRAKEPKIGVHDSLVIDLVDTDEEEEDEDFLVRNTGNSRQSSSSQILVDSSEEESHIPTYKYPVRQRVPTKTLHIESDSDDEQYEALSDFDDGSSSDSDLRAPSRRSFSKLAKNPSRLDLDTENWNPNIMKLKETMTPATFKKKREALSKAYFDEYNNAVFEGQLATQVNIVWSNKLRTTAGLTRLKRRQVDFTPGAGIKRSATIELSTKVLNDPERLASTLLHEMVHAAAWILDNVSKPPHGACFAKWAKLAMLKIPGSRVTTTHDYQIEYKYAWACSHANCKFLVQRHSRSVDVSRKCCGYCRGRLIEVEVPGSVHETVNKTPKKRAPPSGYNLFVREQSAAVREELLRTPRPGATKITQAQVMTECARLWREKKTEASRTE